MEAADQVTSRRIHIGNISPKLAENGALEARLAKFGPITKSILFHTKPVNDFYFAFVEIDLSEKQFEKLKLSLNGILFMGRKLLISLAKPDFQNVWQKDSHRPETTKKVLEKQEGIARARSLRIKESQTPHSSNSITGAPVVKTSTVGPNSSNMGYFKSAHTYMNASANTKNKSPTHDLIGAKSYSSTLMPRGSFTQQYSRSNGGGELIKGRMRKTARPEVYFVRKQQTMRTLINGELKHIKSYKTKLWGVEKNKTARDLTYSFHNNAWHSGDDHIVERVGVRKVVEETKPDNGDVGSGDDSGNEISAYSDEHAKNASVVANLFAKYDFDKPVVIEEDSEEENVTYDSKGRKNVPQYDYEAQGVVEFGDDGEIEDGDAVQAKSLMDTFKESHERPVEMYYDEDDEGNDVDVDTLGQQYSTEAIKKQYDEEHELEMILTKDDKESTTTEQIDDDEESIEENVENSFEENVENNIEKSTEENNENESSDEEDLMPKFGQVTNNTNTLRSLFNQDKSSLSGFNLALEEDDIDLEAQKLAEEEREKLLEQIKSKQKEQLEDTESPAVRHDRFGLFWTHFDSPFLQTQTQLSKIGHVGENIRLPGETEGQEREVRDEGHGEEDEYERWFWSMRGEVSRECKRRKRDVTRMFKKRSAKPFV